MEQIPAALAHRLALGAARHQGRPVHGLQLHLKAGVPELLRGDQGERGEQGHVGRLHDDHGRAVIAGRLQRLGGRLRDLTASSSAPLGWGLVIGLGVALWSATASTKAMLSALNICYRESEKRGIFHFQALSLAFTLAGIVGVIVALAIIVGVPAVVSFNWLGPLGQLALRLVSWTLLAGFIMVAMAALYRYGPSRREARWRWITPGSLLVAVLWLLSSAAFSFYVANFGAYNATYGSLGAAVVLALWFYITAFVVLLGALLNAELELQTAHDTTVAPVKPMGSRGAFVADHMVTS
ncbi:MAG: YihY/virulence factor BrkB family protein [Rhodospirillaceae bacterium]|nr:YihY/virulence factor BrkB family protein [Rhodospirillaceae bacterium]